MSINDSMTALADEIREISGETQLLGIDDMREEIAQANDEVDIQTNLINQLISMANNLPEAGSGDGPSLPVLTNEGTYADLLQGKQLIDGSGGIVVGTIPTKTQSDLTANGATVTVPSGYYATQTTKSVATATRGATTISVTADDTNDKLTVTGSNTQAAGYVTDTAAKTASTTITLTASGATVTATETGGKKVSKSVASGSATTPNRTITLRPLISVDNTGEISLTGSVTDTFAPTVSAGYVSSGVAGTITATAEGTKQLTTQAEKTVTPTKSSQTAVARGVYTTGVVTVGPIPSQYIIPSGTKEVTENGTYDVTQYEDVHVVITPDELELQEKTVTPTTSQQTIVADTGYDALSKVTISAIATQSKSTTPTKNTQNIVPDSDKFLSSVTVNPIPNDYIIPTGETTISSNGVYDVKTFASANVYIEAPDIVLQDKTATPSTSVQVIQADENYDGLDTVTINPIPADYVKPTGSLEIIENGIYEVNSLASVVVNVPGAPTEPDYHSLYQRVEYITSSEEDTYPYLITDVCADNEIGAEVVASFPALQDRIPMGSRQDSGTTRFYVVYPMSTSSIYYGFNTGSTVSCALKVNTIYRCQTNFLNSRLVNVYDSSGIRKGGASLSATLTAHTVPISIFGYNSASSGNVTSKREYKLYSARISRKHEVIRNYIPCYRKSDGVVGLYETITNQFLTPPTGAFITGAEIDWEDV